MKNTGPHYKDIVEKIEHYHRNKVCLVIPGIKMKTTSWLKIYRPANHIRLGGKGEDTYWICFSKPIKKGILLKQPINSGLIRFPAPWRASGKSSKASLSIMALPWQWLLSVAHYYSLPLIILLWERTRPHPTLLLSDRYRQGWTCYHTSGTDSNSTALQDLSWSLAGNVTEISWLS